jgi:hypothetical protein
VRTSRVWPKRLTFLAENLSPDLLFRQPTTRSVWQLRQSLLDIRILICFKDLSKDTHIIICPGATSMICDQHNDCSCMHSWRTESQEKTESRPYYRNGLLLTICRMYLVRIEKILLQVRRTQHGHTGTQFGVAETFNVSKAFPNQNASLDNPQLDQFGS